MINSDLGCSAAMGAATREGFERVLSAVALGEVGIVASREVSRLSRTDKDWCRLAEVCQIFGTLIGDEQQVYDLNYLDDQLVLGIKGNIKRRRVEGPQAAIASRARIESTSRRVTKTAPGGICQRRNRQSGSASRPASLRSHSSGVCQVPRTLDRAADLSMVS